MEINVAGAGAGKTTKMADLITEYDIPDGKIVFCIAFTNTAADNIMNHIKAKQGSVPKNIRISTIHSFLYQELIRPFYFLLFKKHYERISAINLPDTPQYKNIQLKELENDNLLHFSSIPQRAKWIVDKKSGDNKAIKDTRKKVLSFISDYCAAIFIDEAQDIDDDVKLIIEALDKAGISIFLYGDPKQDVKGFGNYRALINNAQSVHYNSCCHRCPQKHLNLSNTLASDEEKQIADEDNAEGAIEIVFETDIDNNDLFMTNGSFELKYISKKTDRFDTHERKGLNAQFDTLLFELQRAMHEKWRDNTTEHEICRAAFYVTEQMFADLANGLSASEIINKWIAESYRKNVPDSLTVKEGTVLSTMSRLLPNFKDEGLTQDRLFVTEITSSNDEKYLTDVIYNRSHTSSETIFSSSSATQINVELEKYFDCTAVFRHNSTIESSYNLYKSLELIYEHLNGISGDDDTPRFVPVLSIDNAGLIPEEYPFYQIPAISNYRFDDIGELRRIIGEMDAHIIKYFEQNPDAAKQLLHEAVVTAKNIVSQLPYRARSSSAVMFLATAIILTKLGFLDDKDVSDMADWLKNESNGQMITTGYEEMTFFCQFVSEVTGQKCSFEFDNKAIKKN